VLGLARNLSGLADRNDVSSRELAATYLDLRVRRALRPGTSRAEIAHRRVRCRDFPMLVTMYEEIWLRRHYPFEPRRADPVVFDCGASIGLASLYFKTVAPAARITAFEPEPATFELLRENLADSGVECINAAVAAAPGKETLRVPSPSAAEGGATLRLAEGAGWDEIEVTTVRLSDCVTGPVDFLKLDIEGAEREVVDDLARTGAIGHVAELALEYHPTDDDRLGELLQHLRAAGFRYRFNSVSDLSWGDYGQPFLIHATRS
jgi:FkbM family methyltransferase